MDVKECHILVVDDLAFNRQMIEGILRAEGYRTIIMAEDGLEALAQISRDKPDLVILDLIMPHMDGYAVLREVRSQSGCDDIPILVQTASNGVEDKNRAFEAGATDFFTKPLSPVELKSRVAVHLHNRVLTRELRAYQARMSLEVDAAKIIQTSMLPPQFLIDEKNQTHGVCVASFFKGSSELSGDLWGFLKDCPQGMGYYMGDFVGHGVSAAVNTFRLHTLMGELDQGQPLEELVFALNNKLCDVMATGQYATFYCGRYDAQAQVLRYVATGCPAPLIRYRDGTVVVGHNAGLPLGIMKDHHYEIQALPFQKADLLLTHSDALYAALSLDEEDVDTLKDILGAFRYPCDLIAGLTQGVHNRVLADDLTLVAMRPGK